MTVKMYAIVMLGSMILSTACGTVGGVLRQTATVMDPPTVVVPADVERDARIAALTTRIDSIDTESETATLEKLQADLADTNELIALLQKAKTEEVAKLGSAIANAGTSAASGIPIDWSTLLAALTGSTGTMVVSEVARRKRKALMKKTALMIASEPNTS